MYEYSFTYVNILLIGYPQGAFEYKLIGPHLCKSFKLVSITLGMHSPMS